MSKKSPLKTSVQVANDYKFVDKRGTDKSVVYNKPSNSPNSYRPRIMTAGTAKSVITPSDRESQMNYGRTIFATTPNLGSSIVTKNQYAVGTGWTPQFMGVNEAWGNVAERWLKDWFSTCNVLGGNYDFRTSLFLTGVGLDVDGDNMVVLTTGKNGYPQIQLIGANRIGCRHGETLIKGGTYDGYEIVDGVIINTLGRPIAYKILGEKAKDDYIVSTQESQLVSEPEWSEQYRGISRVARAVLDCMDIQDIDEYIKRQIKLQSSVGIVHHTETGQPDSSTNLIGMDVDNIQPDGTVKTGTYYNEQINGGDIYYMKAGSDEKLESFQIQNPSTPTAEFLNKIERRTITAVGWSADLLDPSKVGGASVRLVTDIARASIRNRQLALERRAKFVVSYAIAKAMNLGLLPDNRKDRWFDWSFTKPQLIVTDAGYEEQADRENLKSGTTTLSAVAAKKGLDWSELRDQKQKETEDLLVRANILSTKYNITLSTAITLLQQNNPNAVMESNDELEASK